MPKVELSELLFIAMMFIVVIVISIVSIYLFVRQFKREKQATIERKNEKEKENKEE